MSTISNAEKFVSHLYSTFPGRVPFTAGYTTGFAESVYPLVYENEHGVPIGLIAAAANNHSDTSEVQLFHVSAFKPGIGHGKEIMNYICNKADQYRVKIYLQAEVQFSDLNTPVGPELVAWYRQFGFIGSGIMTREPNA